MKKLTVVSIILNAVVLFMLACGGASSPSNGGGGIVGTLVRIASHVSPRGAVYGSQHSTIAQNLSLTPKAFAQTTASVLPESFEVSCDWVKARGAGLHAALGHSGLAPFDIPTSSGLCGTSQSSSTPALSVGTPVTFNGTFQSFIAYAVTVSGSTLRCTDADPTTGSKDAVTDTAKFLPYYDLANDKLIVANVSTQTPITLNCSFTIPAGDDIRAIEFRWAKT